MGDKDASADASDKKNAIFFDRIQAETIKKELRVHKLYDRYMLSPHVKSKLVVTNKPQSMSLAVDEIEDDEYCRFEAKAKLTPREKFAVPATSSQVCGWDAQVLFRTTDPRFYRPRVECEITKCWNQGVAKEEKGAAAKK
ncbi:FAM183A and FAM183B related-domain-containing protein [Zopfochytrium polystomum]|nr:FAM183A and FAM183B related-domain-containing protein [Zopfochytrium polystomum]